MENREYKLLTIPAVSWDKKELSSTHGELIAQPLEPGFGITLGNALRRVLLGAVEGSAVTSITVKGINNEFTAIPGVVEDAMQLVLNIKEIVIKNKTGMPGKMNLRVVGESVALAGDIQTDEHLEIVNKDHVLARVAQDKVLEIEFFVESGRGYVPAQWPTDKAYQDDERIYLDAMFSPIRKVMVDVTKTRVGKDIDYDKLALRIYTNGSESPIVAMNYAVSVLRTQLEHFLSDAEIPFNNISAVAAPEVKKEPVQLSSLGLKKAQLELLLKPIDDLELSVRAHNCLINADIKRVIDLVNKSEDEVLKIKNLGRKSLGEMKESMKSFGLTFGMNVDEEAISAAMHGNKE